MIDNIIVQFWMQKGGNIASRTIYPDDHAVRVLYPGEKDFLRKKIYYDTSTNDAIKEYYMSHREKKVSLIAEGTLTKHRNGFLFSFNSLLHTLNTEQIQVDCMLDESSKELTITLWEADKYKKFIKYLESVTDDQEIFVKTADVESSTGIHVAKVVDVVVQS